MKQLTQELKAGKMELIDVPCPTIGDNEVLVKNLYSAISPGTESKTVIDARKGYIAKARSRQKEFNAVLKMAKSEGLLKTYNTVMNKLEAPAPLGYSCVGEIIEIGSQVKGFSLGDIVACGGGGAVHAEIVSVSKNLCVKVPDNVLPKYAAFTTIGSIAIQGIRQADLKVGENCVVIGLGLVGQITCQLLDASGVIPIGIDLDSHLAELAKKNGAIYSFVRNTEGLENTILDITRGYGADAVIVTAATKSLDPVELAGKISRKKGRVIIVGAVPTGFSRENYYKKELDLRMSCSYGPGRYDDNYENKGYDYPIGYVRFTENRNMQTFVDLLSNSKIKMSNIITHEFAFENAEKAYKMILERQEFFCGILLSYSNVVEKAKKITIRENIIPISTVKAGFIGAGSFAQNALLPRLQGKCSLIGVASIIGTEAKYVAGKYGFSYYSSDAGDIIKDDTINSVFIVTRHNTHAKFIIEALKAGKNVYVEKPLAMNMTELEEVKDAYEKSNGISLMLGFNRRFSPFTKKIMTYLNKDQIKAINIRVNAGILPPDHWVHDPMVGGGRIIGEVCHFIDLAMYIASSPITDIVAYSKPNITQDTVSISLLFANGSIANISYFSNGNKLCPKERIEVFCDGAIFIIDDFITLTEYTNRKKTTKSKQDKGHSEELKEYLKFLKEGGEPPISFDEIYLSSKATLLVLESIKQKRAISL
jgi:polar amino acid transport system substrate-binding protein